MTRRARRNVSSMTAVASRKRPVAASATSRRRRSTALRPQPAEASASARVRSRRAVSFASSGLGVTQRSEPSGCASQRRSVPESARTITRSAVTGSSAGASAARAELEDVVEERHPADERRERRARLEAVRPRDEQAAPRELRDERGHAPRLEAAAAPGEQRRDVADQPLRGRGLARDPGGDRRVGDGLARRVDEVGEGLPSQQVQRRPPARGTPRRRGPRRGRRPGRARSRAGSSSRAASSRRGRGRQDPQAPGDVDERDRVARRRRSTTPSLSIPSPPREKPPNASAWCSRPSTRRRPGSTPSGPRSLRATRSSRAGWGSDSGGATSWNGEAADGAPPTYRAR